MYTHTNLEKETRINIRSSPSEKILIDRAARLSNLLPSQFMRMAILEKARHVIEDVNHFTLSKSQWEVFIAALDAEPKEIPSLKKLFSKKSLFE